MKFIGASILCFAVSLPALALDKTAGQRNHIYLGMTEVRTDLDVLFAVDSSGSMSMYQQILAQSSVGLEKLLIQKKRNYHLGVINMDTEVQNYAGAPIPGALLGNPKVITSTDQQGLFAGNLRVGTTGSYLEAPFDAVSLALSPTMLAKENVGFIRPDARLAIVLVTDAEDQSKVMPHQFLHQLENLKGDLENIKLISWIVPTTVSNSSCFRDDDSQVPTKIEEITRYLKGSIYNLCAMDQNTLTKFHQDLASFGVSLQPSSLEVPLKVKPDVATILVKYGSQTINLNATTGWDYDIAKNAIVFGPKIVWTPQPMGTRLHISFYPKL